MTLKSVWKGIINNNHWTLALSIFYVGYCTSSLCFSWAEGEILKEWCSFISGLLEMPANGS